MDLYEKCIEKWGIKSQLKQAMGECGEFVGDAQNFMRKKIPLEKLMGEAVDVHIMMMQVRALNPDMFDSLKEETLKKIEEKVDKR
jgi:hypothetical protein